MESKTLFDKFGGSKAIEAVVDTFYNDVMADDELSPFFAETNMKVQRQHQTNFISYVLGGPKKYEGKSMKDSHAHLKISNKDFDKVAFHLTNALKHHGVDGTDLSDTMKIVETTRADIVTV